MTDERRFNDREVAAILKKAAELSQPKTAGGMTLEELERIAAEAGLDPAAVRQAAVDVERGGTGSSFVKALIGGPTAVRFTFELDGELEATHHESLLACLQRNIDQPGSLSAAGRTFSWHTVGQNNNVRNLVVTISPAKGRTVVRIEERMGGLIGGIYGGVFGGVGGSLGPLAGIGGGILLGPLGIGLGVAGALGASFVGTRAIYRAVSRKRQAQVEALAGDLKRTLDDILRPAVVEQESALQGARERQGLLPASDAEQEAARHEEREHASRRR